MVLENNHKKFMKTKGPLIFTVISAVIVWYLVPFILTFLQNVPFSFGPTGYKFNNVSYFFYSGIISRSDD